MEITFPTQVIYLAVLPFKTTDGDAYIFLAIDHFSKFVFELDITDSINDDITLDCFLKLNQNSKFKAARKRNPKPFTIILPSDEGMGIHLEEAFQPLCKVKADYENWVKYAIPIMDDLLGNMN